MTQIIKKYFGNWKSVFNWKTIFASICGISNKWFQSYLVEHQQFVSSNNSESSQLKVPCGIP